MNPSQIILDIETPTETRYLGLIGNIGEQIAREIIEYPGDLSVFAYHLNLVLTEAASNAIKYANESPTLRLRVSVEAGILLIQVFDQGQGFDFNSVAYIEPDEMAEQGRGFFIMRQIMDSVDYRMTEHGNVLELTKKIA